MFDIRIEGKQPIYEQICGHIAELIANGALSPGERLPTVRETARMLGINPNTVQKAYMILEQRGFIYSVPAKGSYVTNNMTVAAAARKKSEDELKEAMEKAKKTGVEKSDALHFVDIVWDGKEDKI